MTAALPYSLLADLVLALHASVVAFVLGGLVLIVAGNRLGWRWVNTYAFRIAHFAAIGVVVAQAWLGVDCPLTTLEMGLRERSGGPTYAGSFIAHWLQRALYHEAPAWVFTAAYSVFALAVAATWWMLPPQRHGRRGPRS